MKQSVFLLTPFLKSVLLACIFLNNNIVTAQSITHTHNETESAVISLGAGYHKGFIFAHSKNVQNTSGSYPSGIELSVNLHQRSQRVWDLCNCYPRNGFSLQYFNYDNTVLGRSVHLNTFLEPYFNIRKKIQLSVRGLAGLSYLTNPYHPTDNPTNMSYSLALSGYVALGAGIHLPISNRHYLHLHGLYNHISNGGLKEPNKGINWPTAFVSYDYSFSDHSMQNRSERDKSYTKNIRIQSCFYTSTKTLAHGEKKRWLIIGINTLASKQISTLHQIHAGMEVCYDYVLKERMRLDETDKTALRSGVLLGHDFLLGRFLLSQSIGVYISNPARYYDVWYQRYGLSYYFNRRLSAGINVLAHTYTANFIDFRLGYYWK